MTHLLNITKFGFVAVVAFSGMAVGKENKSEDVRYRGDETELAALLMTPISATPVPAAVIIQGSGTSDRSNRWARDIAEELLQNGIAVLLTDKRGSGASEGNWRTASFSDLASDILAGVNFLRGRTDIDSAHIGVVGLSQGGQIAPLAATRSDHIAFVINVSGGAIGFAEASFREMANTARQSGLSKSDVNQVLQLNLSAVRYLTTGKWAQYARKRKQVLETGAKEIAEGFPAKADAPIWTFLRSAVTWDPLVYWVQVTQPVLIVYGEDDEHDNVPVAESVRRLEHAFASVGKTNVRLLVVPGAGHGVRDTQTHKLHPQFKSVLAAWAREHTIQIKEK